MAIQITPNYRKPSKGILQEPDERLRKISKKVDRVDSVAIEITDRLIEVLNRVDSLFKPWLGMAAPQLGYNLRIIAVKKSLRKYQIMINPEILSQKWFFPAVSGCYSLRGMYLISSPYWVKVKYTDMKNTDHVEVFCGNMAILLKQEIDHLDGKLICD